MVVVIVLDVSLMVVGYTHQEENHQICISLNKNNRENSPNRYALFCLHFLFDSLSGLNKIEYQTKIPMI